MQAELHAAIKAMRGPKGDELRANNARIRKLLRDSKANGGAKKAALSINRYFTEK